MSLKKTVHAITLLNDMLINYFGDYGQLYSSPNSLKMCYCNKGLLCNSNHNVSLLSFLCKVGG